MFNYNFLYELIINSYKNIYVFFNKLIFYYTSNDDAIYINYAFVYIGIYAIKSEYVCNYHRSFVMIYDNDFMKDYKKVIYHHNTI